MCDRVRVWEKENEKERARDEERKIKTRWEEWVRVDRDTCVEEKKQEKKRKDFSIWSEKYFTIWCNILKSPHNKSESYNAYKQYYDPYTLKKKKKNTQYTWLYPKIPQDSTQNMFLPRICKPGNKIYIKSCY